MRGDQANDIRVQSLLTGLDMSTKPTDAKKKLLREESTYMAIYFGSLWHEYCAPFVTVVGYNKKQVQTKLYELAEAEYELMMDQDDERSIECNILTGGISKKSPEFLEDLLAHEEEFRRNELERDGITVF